MRKTKILKLTIFTAAVLGAGSFVNVGQAKEFLGRGLVCLPKSPGVYCAWRLLPIDDAQTGFNIYRSTSLAGPFSPINGTPIMTSTNYHDTSAVSGQAYYQIRPVKNGAEGERSEVMKVTAGGTKNYIDIYKDRIKSLKSTSLAKVGDLNGDGVIDFVASSPAPPGGKEADCPADSVIQLEGIIHKDGEWKSSWIFSTDYKGCGVPSYLIWDLDGDGKSEVVADKGEHFLTTDLVIINGETGKLLAQMEHARHPMQPYTGVGMTIGHLKDMNGDGIADPFIITDHGMYSSIVPATGEADRYSTRPFSYQRYAAYYYDGSDLKRVYDLPLSAWAAGGRGSHGLPTADIDVDGKDELMVCGLVIDDNFNPKFEANGFHNDVCYTGDIDPNRPGLETYMGTELGDIAQMIDAGGNQLWKKTVDANFDGWEQGWCSELKTGPGYEGLECYAYETKDMKEGGNFIYGKIPHIFTSGGRDITRELIPEDYDTLGCDRQPTGPRKAPIDWDGGEGVKEIYHHGNPPDIDQCSISWYGAYLADILGDSREEVITGYPGSNYVNGYFRIYINNKPTINRYLTPLADRDYRASVMRSGVGYKTNYVASKSGQKRTDVVYSSGTPPACASYEYSPEDCQPDGTQKLNVVSVSPLGCVGGNRVLSQSCTYAPPRCNEVDAMGTYFEAEHFTDSLAGKGDISVATSELGFLGEGYLKTANDGSTGSMQEAKEYELYFSKAGTYKAWVRGIGYDGFSDSVSFGINGVIKGDLFYEGDWNWTNNSDPKYGIGNTFTINQPGIYKFNVFIRDFGFLIDAIYLTQNDWLTSNVAFNSVINPTSCGDNPADVNSDGQVNIKDIQAVIRCIINTNCGVSRADVNGDGKVNIKDIQAIIRKIINP